MTLEIRIIRGRNREIVAMQNKYYSKICIADKMVVSFEENQTLMTVSISQESFPVDASLKKRYNKKVEN